MSRVREKVQAGPVLKSGAGSDGMRGRLTALNSADPMVFFSTLSFEHNLIANESFVLV